MRRSTGIKLALGFVALFIAGLALVVLAPRASTGPLSGVLSGASELRDYLGRRLVGIANAHLVPRLDFETIDYEAPRTVRLGSVSLTAPDGTRVFDARTLVVTLRETPRTGEPIRIQNIELEGGSINLRVDPETGSIRGLLPLVKRSPIGAPAGDANDPTPEDARLSNVLALERVRVSGLDLVYDDGSGAEPTRLPGLFLEMDVAPAGEGPEAPGGAGWYEIAFRSGRRPGLELDLTGRFNIDTLTLWTPRTVARVDLSPETVSTLPAPLASTLREHDVRGEAQATFLGSIPLRDPASSDVSGELVMTDASVASGEYQLPVERLDASAQLRAGRLSLTRGEAVVLGGSLRATADARLTEPDRPATARLELTNIDLERLLRTVSEDPSQQTLAGLLSGVVDTTTTLTRLRDSLSGTGTLKVREGILVRTPGLKSLADAAQVASLTKPGDRTHRADAEFDLDPNGAAIRTSRLETPTLLARGDGRVNFDRSLDLSVNAGPLEKLQGMLGQAGRLLGTITDQLVTYKITGTLDDPKVTVAPLGIDVAP